MKAVCWLVATLALVVILFEIAPVHCSFSSVQSASKNMFSAFSSGSWTQTSYNDFYNDTRTNVDITASQGNVVLKNTGGSGEGNVRYKSPGMINSTVLDTGIQGARIDLVEWNATFSQGKGTNISFFVRASNSSFSPANTTLKWVLIGNVEPVTAGLPTGRYIQWAAVLTTSQSKNTPAIADITVWYH